MKIPLLIIGLIILYIILSSFTYQEDFNVVNQQIIAFHPSEKKDLVIKVDPRMLKGHLPIAKPHKSKKTECPMSKSQEPKKGLIMAERENTDKYIKESMLLKFPNHTLGFQPSNVREMDLTFLKPNQIGKIPLFKQKIPQRDLKIPKIPMQTMSEEE